MYSLCGDVEKSGGKKRSKKGRARRRSGRMNGKREIFSESHESSCTIINKFEQPLRPK